MCYPTSRLFGSKERFMMTKNATTNVRKQSDHHIKTSTIPFTLAKHRQAYQSLKETIQRTNNISSLKQNKAQTSSKQSLELLKKPIIKITKKPFRKALKNQLNKSLTRAVQVGLSVQQKLHHLRGCKYRLLKKEVPIPKGLHLQI